MNLVLFNGNIVDYEAAKVSLDDIDALYGYGVYETLKLRKGIIYYPDFHEERLLSSARIIGIRQDLKTGDLKRGLETLVQAVLAGKLGPNAKPQDLVQARSGFNANLKVVLIGHSQRPADLYAFLLNPLFPDRKELRQGAKALIYHGERHFPAAKSLSMLMSTIAFREAQAKGAYDALLVSREGKVREGTRTNLFYYWDQEGGKPTVFTPPHEEVLEGITRRTLIDCLNQAGYRLEERSLPLESLTGSRPPSLFLTSTSTKILPIRELLAGQDQLFALPVPASLREIQKLYDSYLEGWAASQGLQGSALGD